jgi:succinate dehydrogenase/fumarate reductase flavoprotein subunit
MEIEAAEVRGRKVPVHRFNTIVVGSGAASLSAADHLHNLGQEDLAVITAKVGGGISHNSGSDKQTYYKLSVFGKEGDSPYEMARSLYQGGSMHGDIALVESLLSPRGYKTDHDPRQRATSAGPWTSRIMVQRLLEEVKRRGIRIFDGFEVIALISDGKRVHGAAALDRSGLAGPGRGLTLFLADNVVFGVGGPGGLYKSSVYPEGHDGAIGLALEIGAKAVNLTESQFGLASTKFRWNVSGTYQQVIPRYISAAPDGTIEREFLNPYFPGMDRLATDIFLKGYQWPFDCRRIRNHGSSLIDVLVTIETGIKGRRVFMDFRANPKGGDGLEPFTFACLGDEARIYLEKSGAAFGAPIDRLKTMNPLAVDLYRQNGIDIETEPLEVAVCAQHNNGGLAVDVWWESNIHHLFPVGEVAGTHGVARPGGSALNSGQVGSLRAAQRIVHVYRNGSGPGESALRLGKKRADEILRILDNLEGFPSGISVPDFRDRFQERMTRCAAHVRKKEDVEQALREAYAQIREFGEVRISGREETARAMASRHLVLAHAAYLEAIRAFLEAGGGSRGSSLVLDEEGLPVLEGRLEGWRFKPENESFRDLIVETSWDSEGEKFVSSFGKRRPIPEDDSWFENVWGDYVKGIVFV